MILPVVAAHGGKRAFLRAEWRRLRGLMGAYRAYGRLDPGPVRRLIFVCQGNICRSPFAAAVAAGRGLPVLSGGLAAAPGTPANDAAVSAARRLQVDLAAHRARRFADLPVTAGDLLVGFEPEHCLAMAGAVGARDDVQVVLLGLWLPRPLPHLQDPYGLPAEYFATCFGRIVAAVDGLYADLAPGRSRP